ncbi:hypothetical protein ACH50_14565 [Franconibacter pulveris]|uniref:Uncharacterized protein n=1 Tax=Franconibacter pulveris TaxID=435910 RepID=A0A0J8VL60_9ENTR|nr:hypothetical protein ACH50_14565 [Franconibacter pulveris]
MKKASTFEQMDPDMVHDWKTKRHNQTESLFHNGSSFQSLSAGGLDNGLCGIKIFSYGADTLLE